MTMSDDDTIYIWPETDDRDDDDGLEADEELPIEIPVTSCRIREAGSGLELIVTLPDGTELVAFEKPPDMLYVQLLRKGLLDP